MSRCPICAGYCLGYQAPRGIFGRGDDPLLSRDFGFVCQGNHAGGSLVARRMDVCMFFCICAVWTQASSDLMPCTKPVQYGGNRCRMQTVWKSSASHAGRGALDMALGDSICHMPHAALVAFMSVGDQPGGEESKPEPSFHWRDRCSSKRQRILRGHMFMIECGS